MQMRCYRSGRNRCRRAQLRCGPSASAAGRNPCRIDGTAVDIGRDWQDIRTSDAHSDKSVAGNSASINQIKCFHYAEV